MLVNQNLAERLRLTAEAEIRDSMFRMLEGIRDETGLKVIGISLGFSISEFKNKQGVPGFKIDLDMRLNAEER